MLNPMGMKYDRALLMGMPHLCVQDDKGYIALEPNAHCVICNKPATDKHHVVPKGIGGGSSIVSIDSEYGHFVLRSPLFAVCGMGNASGCHGDFSAGRYDVKWVWDDPQMEVDWFSGELLAHGWVPHDKRLWDGGHYEIRDKRSNRILGINQGE